MKSRLCAAFAAIVITLSATLVPFYAFAETSSSIDDNFPDKIPDAVSDRIIPHKSASASCSWYCRHTENGEIPVCPPEMNYLTEKGGIFLGNTDEKVIYLTFDAGYENGNIAKILDTLSEKKAHGAFFVLENLARQNPDLIKRMSDEGHLVCNHTATHRDMSEISDPAKFKAETKKLETVVRECTGVECTKFFRPPEGRISEGMLDCAASLGYKTVMWSFAYADWDNASQPSPERAMKKILSGTHNGMIILLHPTSATNAAILGSLIDSWRADGYRFGSLDEIAAASAAAVSLPDSVIRCHANSSNKIALTFDDGPHPVYTRKILDILDKYGVHATFFTVGENAEAHPDILRECAARGHEIANHTYSHKYLNDCEINEAEKEISSAEAAISDAVGTKPHFLRPPGGILSQNALEAARRLGYGVVLWNVDTRDWAHTPSDRIFENVTQNVKSGDIILMHDYIGGKSPTPEALEMILPALTEKGYRFVTISELMES